MTVIIIFVIYTGTRLILDFEYCLMSDDVHMLLVETLPAEATEAV